MVDLLGKDKGNISLPPRLKSPKDTEHVPKKMQDVIINMQTCVYEIKLEEISKRIRRIKERNEELTEDLSEIQIALTTTDTDTSEHIATLTRQVSVEVAKVQEYKKRLKAMQKERIEMALNHSQKMDDLNKKYTETRIILTSQLKALNTRINSLEDYKKNQPAIQHKLTVTDKFMANAEELVKKKMESIEIKCKLDKEKLKKDMYNQLLDLATQFQTHVAESMSVPIHKLFRENIMLRTNLIKMSNEGNCLLEKRKLYRNDIEDHKEEVEISACDTKQYTVISRIQSGLLNVMKNVFDKMEVEVSYLHEATDHSIRKKCYIEVENARKTDQEQQLHVQELKIRFYIAKKKLTLRKYASDKLDNNIKICMNILFDVKYIVTSMLEISCRRADNAKLINVDLIPYLMTKLAQSKILMEVRHKDLRQEDVLKHDIKDIELSVPEEVETELVSKITPTISIEKDLQELKDEQEYEKEIEEEEEYEGEEEEEEINFD